MGALRRLGVGDVGIVLEKFSQFRNGGDVGIELLKYLIDVRFDDRLEEPKSLPIVIGEINKIESVAHIVHGSTRFERHLSKM